MERRTLKKRLYLSGIDGRAAQLARENGLGYEIADFCYAPVLEDPMRRAEVRAQMAGIGRFWLHAPFAELAPCAIDPLVREVTRTRYRQTVRLARELGVNRLVIHGGFVPQVYFPEWYIEQSVQFWREFLRELPDGMTVALENVMEPEPSLLAEIARQVDDARLGLCLDVGHANTFVSHVPPLEWIAPMAPWLRPARKGRDPDGAGARRDRAPCPGGDVYHRKSGLRTVDRLAAAEGLSGRWMI